MYDAVNAKTKIKLAVISDEYVADTLINLRMESLWDIARVLTGTFHFHCFKPTHKQGNVKASYFKADESFVIDPVTESSLEVSTREDAPNIFATGDYVVVKYNTTYYPGEIVYVFPDTESARVRTMEKSGPIFWKWPNREDILDYFFHDIAKSIHRPTVVSNHGSYISIPELDFV